MTRHTKEQVDQALEDIEYDGPAQTTTAERVLAAEVLALREELAEANRTLRFKAILGDKLVSMHVATPDGLKQTYPLEPRYSTEAVDAVINFYDNFDEESDEWADVEPTDCWMLLIEAMRASREPAK